MEIMADKSTGKVSRMRIEINRLEASSIHKWKKGSYLCNSLSFELCDIVY